MVRSVRIFGDPVLREPARPVERVDEETRALAADLLDTMRAERGVGLAAQQIGVTRAMCVVEIPGEYDRDEAGGPINEGVPMPLVLVNPRLVSASAGQVTQEEGCLSFPELNAAVSRPCSVVVRYLNLDGNEEERELRGFLARAVQHEMDHLNGVLFIDRMSHVKRVALTGRLKRMRRETRAALGLA